MSMRRRIYLRTLWFVARSWFIPFVVGVVTALLIELNFAYELAVAIDEVYSNAHGNN